MITEIEGEKMNRKILLAMMTLIMGCYNNTNKSDTSGIIGEDNRVTITNKYVEKRVGNVVGPTTKCNASLVEKDVILTALHCVPKNLDTNFFFYNADNSFEAKVHSVESKNEALDLIYLKLDKSTDRYFETASIDELALSKAQIYVYDSEKGLVSSINKCVEEDSKTVFTHKCDTIQGYSGSPFIYNDKLVAVHVGFDYQKKENIGIRAVPSDDELLSFASFLPEVSCGTDCYRHCRRKVLGRWVSNPPCEVACVAERELDCKKDVSIKVCGTEIQVPFLAYAACKLAIAALPASCTAGAATSAGTACALDIGLATAACGVSVAVMTRIAQDCIAGK